MKVRFLIFIIISLSIAGCIAQTVEETTTTRPEIVCNEPYIRVGKDCCLDKNDNSVCDKDETVETTLTAMTTTIVQVTTTRTTLPEVTTTIAVTTLTKTCSDGIQNQGEEYIDCGGPCTDCIMMNLGSSLQEYKGTGYRFRLKETKFTSKGTDYVFTIQLPDGYTDERTLNMGDKSYIDHLEFRLLEESDTRIKIYIRPDPEVAKVVPTGFNVLSVGGVACNVKSVGICTRKYKNYVFDLIERDSTKAKFWITMPDGTNLRERWIHEGKYLSVDGIQVGVLHSYVKGGYTVIFVK